jgi:plasmid replication initiation protein
MSRQKKIQPAKEITINADATIKWRNELVNGKYVLTLLEMRMVVALAAHIIKNIDKFESCSISVRELGDFMGLGADESYSRIKTLARKLRKRELFFEWYSTNSKRKSWLVTGWFDFLLYDDEFSRLEFQFSSKIEPMLLQVHEAYVKLDSKPLMAFKGMYSLRFLMLIAEWERIQPYTIAIADLREMLQLGNKYKTFADFDRHVVGVALKEINALTDFSVRAVPQKKSRAYTHYKFYIKRNPKKTIETMDTTATEVSVNAPQEFTEDQQTMINELISYGIGKRVAAKLVREHYVDDIKANIEYMQMQQAAGRTIKNVAGYLRQAITDDYAAAERAVQAAAEAEMRRKMTPEQLKSYDEMKKQIAAIEAAAAEKANETKTNIDKDQLADKFASLRKNIEDNKGKTLDPEPMPEQLPVEPSFEDSLDAEQKARLEAAMVAGVDK